MMALSFFLKGAFIGLSIAAPVGPIGLLCLQRSLTEGRRAGFVTGLGAATADALYGGVAAGGLTALAQFLVAERKWIGLLGGIFLCSLGLRIFRSAPARKRAIAKSGGLLSNYLSTLLLTLANPTTILSFIAIFAGFGLGVAPGSADAVAMVAGVFIGSAVWWLFLSQGVARLGTRLTPAGMQIINRLSGVVIFGFGLYSLATFLRGGA